jgi:UDP-glucose 4-epimerase
VFNIGTGIETTVLELWESCARSAGYGGEVRFAPPRLGELQRIALDWGRANKRLGWEPKTSLDAGIDETADWVRSTIGASPPM